MAAWRFYVKGLEDVCSGLFYMGRLSERVCLLPQAGGVLEVFRLRESLSDLHAHDFLIGGDEPVSGLDGCLKGDAGF